MIVIRDGMTDEQIANAIINNDAPLVFDNRTGAINKTIDQIITEHYNKLDKEKQDAKEKARLDKERGIKTLPTTDNRPASIKIVNE